MYILLLLVSAIVVNKILIMLPLIPIYNISVGSYVLSFILSALILHEFNFRSHDKEDQIILIAIEILLLIFFLIPTFLKIIAVIIVIALIFWSDKSSDEYNVPPDNNAPSDGTDPFDNDPLNDNSDISSEDSKPIPHPQPQYHTRVQARHLRHHTQYPPRHTRLQHVPYRHRKYGHDDTVYERSDYDEHFGHKNPCAGVYTTNLGNKHRVYRYRYPVRGRYYYYYVDYKGNIHYVRPRK